MLENFTFSKTLFCLKLEQDALLPSNKASMFRGGLGSIFKKLHCVNRKVQNCSLCPLMQTCSYSYIFETKNSKDIPRPYLFETPFDDKRKYAKDEILKFELLLFGKAISALPFFIFSFIELGRAQGLTKQKFKFSLKEVLDFDGIVLFKDDEITANSKTYSISAKIEENLPKFSPHKITLHFTTPLRLTENGSLISKPSFEHIVKALTRRINALSTYHCGAENPVKNHLDLINKARGISVESSTLKWRDWTRYSNRQQTEMQLGGLIGNLVFEGDFSHFLPYLIAGSYTHIGKSCVFGLGKYEIL